MSSWIPPLCNSNHGRDPDSDYDNPSSPASSSTPRTPRTAISGVKDDLSAVFRGVAAFLAPGEGSSSSAVSSLSSDGIAGVKNDLAEIQDSFKSGLSLISSKLASNFLHFQGHIDEDRGGGDEVEEEDEEEHVVGITEEVVDVVRTLSTRPEVWIEFPLSLADDFEMSDYQRDHAANIDFLVPELVTLRKKISSQISEGKFWIVYFILLFSRLSEEDVKLLATPQIVEARETLMKKQNTTNTSQEKLMDNMTPERKISNEETGSCIFVDDLKQSENEDISFTDLDNDNDSNLSDKMLGSRRLKNEKGETNEWIQVNKNFGGKGGKKNAGQYALRDKESESDDSNDWFAVDDNDFDFGDNLNL